MDEDTVFGILLLIFFLAILTLPLSITACIAAATTRKWSKEKQRRAHNGTEGAEEANRLVEDSDSENEDEEFLDSEDEQYYRAKREQKHRERDEKEADWQLSTNGKFCKEWKRCWTGPAGSKEQLAKERELKEQDERRKIAREAVREYLRIERKKARRAQGSKMEQEAAMELPTYGNAVAERTAAKH